MDFELTDEQRLIKDTAREFTDSEIVERSRENARNHHFDLGLVKMIADQGYLGAIVPQQYGGAGLDYVSYGLIVEEIGRGDSSVRTVISVQTSLVCSAILKWSSEEQKQRYLPKLCAGEWLGCFGLTEPDTGSDAANQRTRASRTHCWARSATASRWRCRRLTPGAIRWRRDAWASARAAWRSRSDMRRSANSSGARSRASSSSRR